MSCHSTSGGIVSTSLARAVTGLPEKEIQHIFHALKREATGMPAPSELDVAEWRTRQYDLLSRMKKMTDSRRDKLRDRIFRARSESVPDGPTFHAWRTIEARARQTQALAHIDTAVDLDPPGSHAHLYDLGEDGRPKKVWYASYGSNLHRDRFMNYIEGGTPEGSTRKYDGCTDKTPPEADIPIRFAGARPHFALTSRVWRGGIAFIDAQKGETAQGLGRAYEIGITQFDEVVAQENGLSVKFAAPVPLTEALETGRSVIGNGSYETILHIGDYNGAPVLTFTAPFSTREALTKTGTITRNPIGSATPVRMPVMTNKPSAAYLRMIGGGLNETFGMDEIAQADYLRGCPGGDRWTRQQMVRILRGEEPDPPRVPGPENPKYDNTAPTTKGKAKGKGQRRPSTATGEKPGPKPGPPKPDQNPYFSSASIASGVAARSVTEAFTRPNNDQQTRDADGAILEDLRQQGLFPTDTPTSRTGAKPGGLRSRGERSTTGSTGSTSGTSGRNRRGTQNRQTLPGVKTYPTVEEQQRGVKAWAQRVDKLVAERDSIEASVSTLETGLQDLYDNAPTDSARIYATQQNLSRARIRLDAANGLVTKASQRFDQAKAQRPTTYYDPSMPKRNLGAWKAEDERVLTQHRATETALTEQTRILADLHAHPEATNSDIEAANRVIRRTHQRLTGYENRLAEIEGIITGLISNK